MGFHKLREQRHLKMFQRAKKKPNKGVVATTIVVAIIITVVLVPRRNCLLDGGTVIYRSIAFERLYQVEHRHRLYDEAGYVYYEKGYIVTLFGMEVFNNVYVDYNDGHSLEHPPEVEAMNKEIDRVLAIPNGD